MGDNSGNQIIVIFFNHGCRCRCWPRGRFRGGLSRGGGCSHGFRDGNWGGSSDRLGSDLDESRLNFTSFLVSQGSGGVCDHNEVTQGVDIAVLTFDFGTITLFFVSDVGLSVVICHLVSVTVLRIVL